LSQAEELESANGRKEQQVVVHHSTFRGRRYSYKSIPERVVAAYSQKTDREEKGVLQAKSLAIRQTKEVVHRKNIKPESNGVRSSF